MDKSNDKIVILGTFPDEIDAAMLAAELENAGIRAQTAGELTANFRADAPGKVQVLVHERNLEEARDLMNDFFASRNEVDWSQADELPPEEPGQSK